MPTPISTFLPVISVVVPVFRVEKYLDKCIESIVNQTYRDIEIVLVDDGSPDNCPAKCDAWAKLDPRISVIHKKNGGLSDARNVGMEQARGNFLLFVDSDDYIAPNMCERLVAAQSETGSDIVIGNLVTISKDGTPFVNRSSFPEAPCTLPGREVLSRFYGPKKPVFDLELAAAWGKLYKRHLFLGAPPLRFPVGRTYEDNYVSYKALYAAHRITVLPDTLYFYVKRNGSITDSLDLAKLGDFFAVIEDKLAWCRDKDADTRLLIEHSAYLRFFSLLGLAASLPGSLEKTSVIRRYWNMLRSQSSSYLHNPKAGFRFKLTYILCCLGLWGPLKKIQYFGFSLTKRFLKALGLFEPVRAIWRNPRLLLSPSKLFRLL
ncbi:MAG: glycosyltransferase family 2 protein [Duodenibacillus sp.]|nr:glycosyltransferase family 2 protein [Duodenibacillus sp.]